ncbi:MAG: type II toxin-antitoxin system VapC family toxin [Deltaproteobacteria bacterium]|nr:type II toxin-antitoxin system VapC family toxin [Deltaproteobacteria bacterium]
MEDRRILIDTSVVIDHFRKKNKIIEFRDIFIAATAITNDMPLSTLNIKHFERIDDLELR